MDLEFKLSKDVSQLIEIEPIYRILVYDHIYKIMYNIESDGIKIVLDHEIHFDLKGDMLHVFL